MSRLADCERLKAVVSSFLSYQVCHMRFALFFSSSPLNSFSHACLLACLLEEEGNERVIFFLQELKQETKQALCTQRLRPSCLLIASREVTRCTEKTASKVWEPHRCQSRQGLRAISSMPLFCRRAS